MRSAGPIRDAALNAQKTASPRRWPRPWPSSVQCTVTRSRSATTPSLAPQNASIERFISDRWSTRFWQWCRTSCERTDLLPKNPLAKALNYALQRRLGLEVFLDDPEVAIDTNHFHADNRFMPTLRRKPLTDRAAPLDLSA